MCVTSDALTHFWDPEQKLFGGFVMKNWEQTKIKLAFLSLILVAKHVDILFHSMFFSANFLLVFFPFNHWGPPKSRGPKL